MVSNSEWGWFISRPFLAKIPQINPSARGSTLLEQLRKNFEYDYWANDLFLKALTEMAQPPEKAVQLLSHILWAWDVWLARLLREDLSGYTNPNPEYSLLKCRMKLDELHLKWKNYLAALKLEDLQGRLSSPIPKARNLNTLSKTFLYIS
jgi:uncharacterized damage-inducible protein DinB